LLSLYKWQWIFAPQVTSNLKPTVPFHITSAYRGPKKKQGLSCNPRSSIPSAEIFFLKMASFDALLVVFYVI